MKLVRYGPAGFERPGLIDEDGLVRDLSRVVRDITPHVLSPAGLKRLRSGSSETIGSAIGLRQKALPVDRSHNP